MYSKFGKLKLARQVFDEMSMKDLPIWNSMITGYARCGDMDGALELFRSMPNRNLVSWTAMISGYSQTGKYAEALAMFLSMETEESTINHVTIASVLPACASLGALEVGMRIETYAWNKGFFKNLYVSNAVLEMYARCGRIDEARRVFDDIGNRRNLCSWNSMIMGLAIHGKSCEALELYNEMLMEETAPDDVTFVGLLLACTHGGLVVQGRQLFKWMSEKYRINAKLEHYGCMVDLLGRAGELQEAYDLIKSMPMKPDSVVWGALLGACNIYGNVEIGEIAAESLFKLEPWNPGNYVILSNIYASKSRWDRVSKLRKVMKSSQITKAAGYSFIEEGGKVHKFIVEDKSHPRSNEIYEVLNEVWSKMRQEKRAANFDLELEEVFMME